MSTSSDENFLARWSRLKRQPAEADKDEVRADEHSQPSKDTSRSEAMQSDAQPAGEATPQHGGDEESEGAGATPETKFRDFTDFDFEQLDFNSDYTQFMKDDVPEEARNKALRQLWNSNPVLANMDGLDDYCEDYTDAAMVPIGGVRSAYQIGKGFLSNTELAEWEALGRPEAPEVAAAGDGSMPADQRAPEDISSAVAEARGERGGDGDEHGAVPTDAPAREEAQAGDAGALIEGAGSSGAACAAVVKQEERAALDAYEAESKSARSADPGAKGVQGDGSRPSRRADKDHSET